MDKNSMVCIEQFGAVGDGKTLDTVAIQKAVDTVSGKGGGIIVFPAGRYLCGGIELRSNITMHLGHGAVILGSGKIEDYPERALSLHGSEGVKAVFSAGDAENISIMGRGMIDGQGHHYPATMKDRPRLLVFDRCRRVRVTDVELRDSGNWVQIYSRCEDVFLEGITVHSYATKNNDALDITDSCDVCVANCNFDSDDDGITLKSFFPEGCRNISIANCNVRTHCSAIWNALRAAHPCRPIRPNAVNRSWARSHVFSRPRASPSSSSPSSVRSRRTSSPSADRPTSSSRKVRSPCRSALRASTKLWLSTLAK